jgi:hypothetical protein
MRTIGEDQEIGGRLLEGDRCVSQFAGVMRLVREFAELDADTRQPGPVDIKSYTGEIRVDLPDDISLGARYRLFAFDYDLNFAIDVVIACRDADKGEWYKFVSLGPPTYSLRS